MDPGGAAKDSEAKNSAPKDGSATTTTGTSTTGATGAKPGDTAKPATTPPRTPGRLRQAAPVRAVSRTVNGFAAWAKRPTGRLILPAVIAVVLLGAAGTAGAYLVPEALQAAPSPSATPGFPLEAGATAPPGAAAPGSGIPGGLPSGGLPGGLPGPVPSGAPSAPVGTTTLPAQTGVRPADALANWAGQVGTKVGIPVVAVQAYGYAELVVAKTMPACRLSWTTIAAIAKVESSHGSANGAVLGADGSTTPAILGLPLDGKGGRQLIPDTDRGAMDQDTTYDRAVGPLQFIPATWNSYKVDADNSGVADANDIDDASLTAATYLCQGGRDLSRADAWWDAILSYNAVRPYAQKVFEAANEYGRQSRG